MERCKHLMGTWTCCADGWACQGSPMMLRSPQNARAWKNSIIQKGSAGNIVNNSFITPENNLLNSLCFTCEDGFTVYGGLEVSVFYAVVKNIWQRNTNLLCPAAILFFPQLINMPKVEAVHMSTSCFFFFFFWGDHTVCCSRCCLPRSSACAASVQCWTLVPLMSEILLQTESLIPRGRSSEWLTGVSKCSICGCSKTNPWNSVL